ncbi:unnamed protein product, partial [Didymodactylos carnosus]
MSNYKSKLAHLADELSSKKDERLKRQQQLDDVKKQLVENKKQIKNIESKMTTINQDIQKQEHVKSGAEQKLLQS